MCVDSKPALHPGRPPGSLIGTHTTTLAGGFVGVGPKKTGHASVSMGFRCLNLLQCCRKNGVDACAGAHYYFVPPRPRAGPWCARTTRKMNLLMELAAWP